MRKPRNPRDADASRLRILDAARVRFSNCSYEGVGVREITSDAGLDPALITRYFGSKAGLFREVADQAFDTDNLLARGVEHLSSSAARLLFDTVDAKAWRTGYDPLRLLLASIGSPTAGPILADAMTKGFLRPLQKSLAGERAAERGTMIASLIIGMALMRLVLGTGSTASRDRLQTLFEESLAGQV